MISRLRARYAFPSLFVSASALLLACGGGTASSPDFSSPPAFNGNATSAPSDVAANPSSTNTTSSPNLTAPAEASNQSNSEAPPVGARQDLNTGASAASPPVREPGAPWQAPPLDPNTPVGINGQLRVEGRNLVNQNGQPVQLEGVSSMWLNWEDRYSQNRQGLQWLRDNWNLTLYRVALGVEPNNAYLAEPEVMMARLRTAVHNAIDLGVYVLIDWHAHEAHESPEAAEAFFSQVAAEFGQFPHVLYETFNEPLGNHDWSSTIKPYHERIIPVIRAQDPDSVIILGNRQWDQRPDEAAADPVQGENLMYTVHFYACDHQGSIRADAEEAYNAGLALFVTEWGATPADGGADNPIVCADAAQEWHTWMDERSISSAAWKFDTCADSSCFFSSPDAPIDGGWTDEWLTDHAKFIRARLLD